jgi:hypoxanthine-guanine phosphoribosyltransferase
MDAVSKRMEVLKDFQFQVDLRKTSTYDKRMEESNFFLLKYQVEPTIAQKTEILVSDILVRFSCQILEGNTI